MNKITPLILMTYSSIVFAECPSTNPEETLECYFNAVDSKDEAAISEVYLEFRAFHFSKLDKPKREIYKKVTLAKNLVKPDSNGDIPIWAHKGNIEIWVREIYKDFSHMVSFSLKNKHGKWYLAGHSSHDQPE